jgi:uncharacterized protein (DUF2141 family)
MAGAVLLALLATALACPSAALAQAPAAKGGSTNVLHVHVVKLRSSSGVVGCTLYNSPKAFPSDYSKAFRDTDAPAVDGAATCNFPGIPPGTYAVVVIHDENHNGKLDRNFLGIPTEGYAFSNGVRPVFAPPSFNSASFAYKGGEQSLTIIMRY